METVRSRIQRATRLLAEAVAPARRTGTKETERKIRRAIEEIVEAAVRATREEIEAETGA